MIGSRLKLARAAAGLSLRRLADKVSVTAQAIGKYERDESMPSSRVLWEMAEALDVSIDYLMGDPRVCVTRLEFRKKASAKKKAQAQVEAKILLHVERYLFVEELLGLPTAVWDAPAIGRIGRIEDAEVAAEALRDAWDLGRDPIPNLVETLEEHGIKVVVLALDPKVDGVTAWVSRPGHADTPVILINSVSKTVERQRMTLAHELGHLLLGERIRSGLDEEKVVYRFGGAFLCPAESLRSELGSHRERIALGELFAVKVLFKVSFMALVYRCGDLGILSSALKQRLFRKASSEGWRRPPYKEPNRLEPSEAEVPVRFERLCFRAVAEGGLSEAKASELLDISVRELQLRLDPPQG